MLFNTGKCFDRKHTNTLQIKGKNGEDKNHRKSNYGVLNQSDLVINKETFFRPHDSHPKSLKSVTNSALEHFSPLKRKIKTLLTVKTTERGHWQLNWWPQISFKFLLE